MKTTPFWSFNKQSKIEIDEHPLVQFLNEMGYSSYYTNSSNKTTEPQFLYRNDNIVEPISPLRIHSEVIKAIQSGIIDEDVLAADTKKDVLSKLMSSKCITKKETLTILPELSKSLVTDKEKEAYFFYRNNLVIVTSLNIEVVPLDVIHGYIWKSQIVDRDFALKEYDEIVLKSEYYKFLENISCRPSGGKFISDKPRLDHLLALQGYLLHGYKDRANPRAVILMDASDKTEPNGRTGKGIIIEGIGKIKKMVKEDGKSFKDDNRFKFSQITPDTKILFIDDVKENFVFENFFSATSEGLIVEPKYVNKFFILYENSPKIAISTNYAVKGKGSSNEARKYEFELCNFYSDKHLPVHDFGHLFFVNWDNYQWNLFDSLLMYSVQNYLKDGVIQSESISINTKKLISETSIQFFDWINKFGLTPNTKYDKGSLFSDYKRFCEDCPDCNQLLFTKRLKLWALYMKYECIESHSNLNRIIEFKT